MGDLAGAAEDEDAALDAGPTTEKVIGMGEHIASMVARFPPRRASSPDEVAKAVLFLVGDDAANIHGVTLSVAGGAASMAL